MLFYLNLKQYIRHLDGERWSRGRVLGYQSKGWWVNPTYLCPFQKLGNFVHLTLPVTFGRDTKSRRSLLSGVYARESESVYARESKCVTCSGLTNSTRQYSGCNIPSVNTISGLSLNRLYGQYTFKIVILILTI